MRCFSASSKLAGVSESLLALEVAASAAAGFFVGRHRRLCLGKPVGVDVKGSSENSTGFLTSLSSRSTMSPMSNVGFMVGCEVEDLRLVGPGAGQAALKYIYNQRHTATCLDSSARDNEKVAVRL